MRAASLAGEARPSLWNIVLQMENSTWLYWYLLYAMVSRKVLEIFPCEVFGSGDDRIEVLRVDRSVVCTDDEYEANYNW